MTTKYVTKSEENTLRKAKSIFRKQGYVVQLNPVKKRRR